MIVVIIYFTWKKGFYSYVFCRIITAGFSSEFSFHHYFYSLGKKFISNIWFCKFSIQVNRDIDLSPEPKPKFCKLFSLLLELEYQKFSQIYKSFAFNRLQCYPQIQY